MFRQILAEQLSFDKATQEAFLSIFTEARFEKGYQFAKSGEFSRVMGFVQEGMLRAYFTKSNGEHTLYR